MLSNICENAGFIIRITVKLVKYIHIIVPILLVVLISFDLFKAITSDMDDKSKKEAFNKATKRLIYAVIVFLIPTIITFVFRTVNKMVKDDNKTSVTSTSWINCWLAEYSGASYNSNYGGTNYEPNTTSTPRPTATARPTPSPTPRPTATPTPSLSFGCCYRGSDSYFRFTLTYNRVGCESSPPNGLSGFQAEKDYCCGQTDAKCDGSEPAPSPVLTVHRCCFQNGKISYMYREQAEECGREGDFEVRDRETCCEYGADEDYNYCMKNDYHK